MASLMVLVMSWESLTTIEKVSSLMECPVVWEWSKMGERALRRSLYLSHKFLPVPPMYCTVHLRWLHLYLQMCFGDVLFIADAVMAFQCKYWSVCVGFLNTVVTSDLFGSAEIKS